MSGMATDLNLKQAAALLDVHYMTAYRYVRQGRLEAYRLGTAWRVRQDAIEAFRRRRRPNGEVVGVDWVARLVPPLQVGDEQAAWAVIQTALAGGRDATSCYVDLLVPAVAVVSADDADNDGCAHLLAMTVAHRLVARLGAQFRRPGRRCGAVVIGAPQGERHALPVAIVADVVRMAGFEVLELGVDVDPRAFVAAAKHASRLVAVGLSVTSVERLDSAREVIDAVRASVPETPVIVGGQGVLNAEIAELLDADAWAPDARTAAGIIEGLALRPRSAVATGR